MIVQKGDDFFSATRKEGGSAELSKDSLTLQRDGGTSYVVVDGRVRVLQFTDGVGRRQAEEARLTAKLLALDTRAD